MSRALPTRTARPTTRTLGVALALALGLSGCGAGLRAQTYQERTTSDSTNEAIGALNIRHIRVLPPQGAESYEVGSDARVGMVLVNEGVEADRLTSVTAEGVTSVAVAGPDGRPATLRVPGQSTVSEYTFVLRGLTRELRPGQYVQMELVFAENGAETMLVPIEVTGTPGPKREGYEVPHTDSNGDPLVEHEEGEEHSEGEPKGESEGEGDAPGGSQADGVAGENEQPEPADPAGDENGGNSAVVPPGEEG